MDQHDGGWKRTGSRYLFESRWYGLRQDEVVLPNGSPITYTLVDSPGYVLVVALLDDGRVVLERVFRYPLQTTLLECPSGGMDGESPEIAGKRELEEETGWVAGRISSLGSYYGSSGMSNERFHVVLAEGLAPTGTIQREPTEQIEVVLMPLTEACELARTGQITDGPTALSLLLAEARLASRGGALTPP